MQRVLIVVLLGFIFCLSAAYTYRKSGSLISFYGGNPLSRKGRIIRAGVALIVGVICANMRHTSAMVALHLIFLFLIQDLAAGLLRLLFRRGKERHYYQLLHKVYYCGLVPVAVFLVFMIYGFVNMGHVQEKDYTVSTVKEIGDYHIAFVSDIHYGTIQSRDVVREAFDEIQSKKLDILILGGDIVEENTSKESMEEIFAMAGKVKTTYGTYFVYGNHDKQPYTENPDYTGEELAKAIEKNGIRILQDSYVEINGELILAGRDDAGWSNTSGRKTTEELLQKFSEREREEKYILVVDHQPVEAEDNAEAGVDLELSGHTHAGQIWPVGHFTEMAGQLNYGMYQRGKCKVIVSSGVAGWGYALRTQGDCEYMLINLKKQ